ncbi:MAG: PAS domain S-box protein [Spirochaetales bacterium]|nr:PAS domain S-box protein [Spirochaetales bacterium]
MKVLWKLFIPVYLFFVVLLTFISHFYADSRMKIAREHVIEQHKTIGRYVIKRLESGFLESKWPFDSLKELSSQKDFMFWWITNEDNIIYISHNMDLAGTSPFDHISIPNKNYQSAELILNKEREYGILVYPITAAHNEWHFWTGFTFKNINEFRQTMVFIFLIIIISALILLWVLLYVLLKIVLKPVEKLMKGIEMTGKGELTHRVEIISRDEIGSIAHSYNKMINDLQKITVSKLYMDAIIENMLDTLTVLDKDFNIVMANSSFLNLLHYKKEEIIGASMQSIFRDEVENPFNLPISLLLIEKGIYKNYETFYLTRDGNEIAILFNCSLTRGEDGEVKNIICTGRNMTDLRRAKAMLKKQRDWLEVSLSSIGDGVIAADKALTVSFMNPMAEKLTGWAFKDARGREIGDIITTESGANLLDQEGYTESLLQTRGRKEAVPISSLSAPIRNKNGETIGVILVIHDIHKMKAMEDKLRQSEKLSGIGQLAAGIAHEINNPTGYMISNLSIFMDYWNKIKNFFEENPVRKNATLEYIYKDIPALISETLEGAQRIKSIVNNLKDFAHPDTGNLKMTDLNKVLDKSIELVWNEIKYNSVLKKDFQSLPLTLCNPGQMEQVFINLILNGYQAIDKQEGRIEIRSFSRGNEILIEISDNGKGIPRENIDKLFDPFFTTKDIGHGVGLGLSISYGIIQHHGGSLEVTSEPGIYTTFTIILPVIEENNG